MFVFIVIVKNSLRKQTECNGNDICLQLTWCHAQVFWVALWKFQVSKWYSMLPSCDIMLEELNPCNTWKPVPPANASSCKVKSMEGCHHKSTISSALWCNLKGTRFFMEIKFRMILLPNVNTRSYIIFSGMLFIMLKEKSHLLCLQLFYF